MSEKNKAGTKPGIVTRYCSDLSGGLMPRRSVSDLSYPRICDLQAAVRSVFDVSRSPTKYLPHLGHWIDTVTFPLPSARNFPLLHHGQRKTLLNLYLLILCRTSKVSFVSDFCLHLRSNKRGERLSHPAWFNICTLRQSCHRQSGRAAAYESV